MQDVLPHLIWAGVALFAIHEAKAAYFAVGNTEGAADPFAPVDVPDDLLALANQERETWAQEETLRAIRERYEALKNWNGVRSAFGVGRIDG